MQPEIIFVTPVPNILTMHLIYLADTKIPSRSTNSMQIVRMCSAFHQVGMNVSLVYPFHSSSMPEGYNGDVEEFYGVPILFQLRPLSNLSSSKITNVSSISRLVRGLSYFRYIQQTVQHTQEPLFFYGRSLLGIYIANTLRRIKKYTAKFAGIFMELHDLPTNHQTQTLLSQLDGLIVITHSLANDIRQHLSINPQRIWVEPDGTNFPPNLRTPPLTRQQICSSLNLAADKPIVMYTGRVNREKGTDVILEIAANLKDSGCQFVLVGKIYDPAYEERVRQNAWSHIRFTGFLPPAHIPSYLDAADVLLLPSTEKLSYAKYTSPLKLFEYMAAGKPIIASDLPVLQEILHSGQNALLAPTNAAHQWAEAIQMLLANPQLSQALSSQARRDVEFYTWENRAKRIKSHLSDTKANERF